MANFLKKALLSMFVDEKGREALDAHKAARSSLLQGSKPEPPPAPVVAPANPAARTELIRKAIAVRREKSQVLDSLSKVDRLKLQAMAQKAFNIKKKDGGKDH